jgi:hypothetical protein
VKTEDSKAMKRQSEEKEKLNILSHGSDKTQGLDS